jgi:hypothetical protein
MFHETSFRVVGNFVLMKRLFAADIDEITVIVTTVCSLKSGGERGIPPAQVFRRSRTLAIQMRRRT